jgi:hypothetical protein
MAKCTFFDDQQPTELPRWATITQVSAFLAVPRTTVRDTIRQALAFAEPWVKKKDCEDGKSLYLIDTTHALYKAHEQRWKQNQTTTQKEDEDPSSADLSHHVEQPTIPYSHYGYSTLLSQRYGDGQDSSANVLHHWPVFRQRLSSWGIQVFQNVLAEEVQENSWQWRWGDLHGEGYPSVEEALTAALASRLDANEQEDREQDTCAFQTPEPEESPRGSRRSFFAKMNRYPPC